MKKIVSAFMVVASFASGALAVQFPTLTDYPDFLTLTQSESEIHLYDTTGYAPYGVAYADTSAVGLGQDYVQTTTLHWEDIKTELGLIARADLSTKDLYEVSFNPTNKYLALVKITGGTAFTDLDFDQYTGFDVAKDYGLTFTVNGSSLSASMYDGAAEVCSVSAEDSSYTGSLFGVFEFMHDGAWINGKFLNSDISEIPEPGTLTLLAAGLVGLLACAWRKRS